MKYLYLLTAIALGVSGYFAYQDGKLASIHPLLDPNRATGEDREEPALADTGGEKPVSPDDEPEDKGPGASELRKQQLEAERKKKEEAEAMKKEEAARAKEEAAAAKEMALAEYNEKKAAMEAEVDALENQYAQFTDQIRQAEKNRYEQERAWNAQKIKTPDAEKDKPAPRATSTWTRSKRSRRRPTKPSRRRSPISEP